MRNYLVKGMVEQSFFAFDSVYDRTQKAAGASDVSGPTRSTHWIDQPPLFRDRLIHAMARNKRKDQPLAIMLLDLDRFKGVNDTLSHDVGDQLLKEVAARLLESVREVDTVARMGGDEFRDPGRHFRRRDVLVVAKRIVESIGTPFQIGPHRISIGVSIGITLYPAMTTTSTNCSGMQDKAMYAAKQQGGDGFIFMHQPGAHHRAHPLPSSWTQPPLPATHHRLLRPTARYPGGAAPSPRERSAGIRQNTFAVTNSSCDGIGCVSGVMTSPQC